MKKFIIIIFCFFFVIASSCNEKKKEKSDRAIAATRVVPDTNKTATTNQAGSPISVTDVLTALERKEITKAEANQRISTIMTQNSNQNTDVQGLLASIGTNNGNTQHIINPYGKLKRLEEKAMLLSISSASESIFGCLDGECNRDNQFRKKELQDIYDEMTEIEDYIANQTAYSIGAMGGNSRLRYQNQSNWGTTQSKAPTTATVPRSKTR